MAERDSLLFADVAAFIRGLAFESLPEKVVASARRSLLDLIGVAAAGRQTQAASIAAAFASSQLCSSGGGARILFDGRRASSAGAAFAGAAMIDSLDAHDGHVLTKGHAGAAVLPALLAVLDAAAPGEAPGEIGGHEFLAGLVLGYEIATRAGIALHATVPDFHCSGTWNALGCAAVASRLLRLDEIRTRHALGIAEYFAPRGQILRACETPTMVKDGSSWGAHAGVTAALLARDGFTGAPALTIEREDAAQFWNDLGTRWRICEQYFKAYPVCRWAQPAIEAALDLQRSERFAAAEVKSITIESFREAIALGAKCAMPASTDEAQYSLAFPVAAALVFGGVGASEVNELGLKDPRVARLVSVVKPVEDEKFSRLFPAERWARVRIVLADGRMLVSQPARARGNPENPLSDNELREKYHTLAEPVLGPARTARIERAVDALDYDRRELTALLTELLQA